MSKGLTIFVKLGIIGLSFFMMLATLFFVPLNNRSQHKINRTHDYVTVENSGELRLSPTGTIHDYEFLEKDSADTFTLIYQDGGDVVAKYVVQVLTSDPSMSIILMDFGGYNRTSGILYEGDGDIIFNFHLVEGDEVELLQLKATNRQDYNTALINTSVMIVTILIVVSLLFLVDKSNIKHYVPTGEKLTIGYKIMFFILGVGLPFIGMLIYSILSSNYDSKKEYSQGNWCGYGVLTTYGLLIFVIYYVSSL